MKRLYLSIIYTIILVITLAYNLFATDWYVKNGGGGSNNGTSWTNAWTSFSSINWTSINAGDNIYISGGTDSSIYYERLVVGKSGTAGNPITIIAGKYSPSPSGHSGRVIIDGGNNARPQSIYIQNRNYITVKGFECRRATQGVYVEDNANTIILDSLNIYDWYDQAGIMTNGATAYSVSNVVIKNCRIVSFGYIDGQTDGIYSQYSANTVIHNNYIRIKNQQPTAHVDAIQAHNSNGFIITNNILINDSVYSTEGGGMPIILGSEGTNPVIIYNNFCYMGGIWYPTGNISTSLNLRWYDVNPMPPTWVIHNTILVNGPRCYALTQEYKGTFKNNIIAMFNGGGGQQTLMSVWGGIGTLQVDSCPSNLWYRSDGGFAPQGTWTGNGNTGSVSSWSSWVNTYGGTGVNADPKLVINVGYEPDQGALNGQLKYDSPAINAGLNLEPFINWLNTTYSLTGDRALVWEDMNGNSRDNSPTLGAVEYQEGGVDSVPSFSFTALTNRELNTEYIASSPITGVDTVTHWWTTTGAEFKINHNGTYSTTMKTSDPDNGADTVYVKNISSSNYSTLNRETIVGGGNAQNFDVTTKAYTPSGSGAVLRGSNGNLIYGNNGRLIIAR